MDRRSFLKKLGVAAAYPLITGLAAPAAASFRPSPKGWKPDNSPPPTGPPPKTAAGKVTLMAVGDLMTHKSVTSSALDYKTGAYDFYPFFEYVAPIFHQADWVFGNLETRMAGEDLKYTGYPMFNAPDQLAQGLKNAGFDVVSTANNHCLDRFKKGIIRTNEVLDKAGLIHTGTFATPEDRERIRFLVKNNVKIALLAYTYGTNGIPIPKGEEWLVNVIDEELIKKDVLKARALGADFVVCSLHFGWEYHRKPNTHQVSLSAKLVDLGVDVVLGHHPHVVQPYAITKKNGRDRVVIYSMGNFIAGQNRNYTKLGVIFKMDFMKDASGQKRVANLTALPTMNVRLTRNKKRTYRVLPMEAVAANEKKYDIPPYMLPGLKQNLAMMTKHIHSMRT